jgi:hypothetical protein
MKVTKHDTGLTRGLSSFPISETWLSIRVRRAIKEAKRGCMQIKLLKRGKNKEWVVDQ